MALPIDEDTAWYFATASMMNPVCLSALNLHPLQSFAAELPDHGDTSPQYPVSLPRPHNMQYTQLTYSFSFCIRCARAQILWAARGHARRLHSPSV